MILSLVLHKNPHTIPDLHDRSRIVPGSKAVSVIFPLMLSTTAKHRHEERLA